MSDRYTRIFSYKENTYTAGSPVIIAAGALLLDNTTNNVLAQLKFQSVSENKIKALTVAITQLDVAGRAMGEKIKHQYLDFNVGIGETFGAKVAIPLRDNSARSFLVTVEEAVFEDNSVWESTDVAWEVLPSTEKNITDFELLKQFEMKYGIVYENHFKQEKDLWFCFCGAVNKNSKCHKCGIELVDLDAFDLDDLKKECEKRLAEEQESERLEKERLEEELRLKHEKAKAKTDRVVKRIKKTAIITTPIVCAIIAFIIVLNTVIIPNGKYNDAIALMDAGKCEEAIAVFEALGGYKDSVNKVTEYNTVKYNKALALLDEGKYTEAVVLLQEASSLGKAAEKLRTLNATVISAGTDHTVALKTDGTVVATEHTSSDIDYNSGECNVAGWNDIVAISCDWGHTVGLKFDGTVVATDYTGEDHFYYGQCDVDEWEDIIAISAGGTHTVGLKADGTVVATEYITYDIYSNYHDGQCDVDGWSDIVAVTAGGSHTVGLKADGTVIATGCNEDGECDVDGWSDIVAVSAGDSYTVGLKADGTVVATGKNKSAQRNVDDWKDIIAISAGGYHTVGLKADGTVVATGYTDDGRCDVDGWKDIVAISAGDFHTVGLKADGTVVSTKVIDDELDFGQSDVEDWKDIMLPVKKK